MGIEQKVNARRKKVSKAKQKIEESKRQLKTREEKKEIINTKQKIIESSPYFQEFKENKINEKELLFLYFFEKELGNIGAACRAIRINRQTYYNWLARNPHFKEYINEIKEAQIDIVESKLKENILKGNVIAQMFYLKTIGRERGYEQSPVVQNNIDIVGFEFEEVGNEES